ncbi:microcystin-dependent protein [Nostoc sp. PCC 7524]|uniref:phage tail protein n=1 Tax=Nostoc sp. (strain ATCC 29411 / PCC 7524) TaxID=28072 RepID=UPI00029EDACF|nr:tail fiber protein [Nostoc sp. PCC 7524]AFY49022.1 microcystin-dependent protein [Nostoc sp. PCC 7524]
MTRKVFQNGQPLFAEDVNAIAYPIPDGQDFIGRGPKVIDEYLDDAPTQIKSRFYSFYDRLKVSHTTGLAFSYLGGAVLLSNGVVTTISPGTISVANNATNYIFVGSNGAVQSSTQLPNECFPLAIVTTSGGTVSGGVIDLRDKIIDRVSPGTIPVEQIVPSGTGMEFWGSVLPSGWLWCDGSLYEPSQYPTLFAAIGYTFGQSGTRFRVPDKRGRVSVGAGQGSGLTNRLLGQIFGEESVTLNVAQLPSHSHGINDLGHSHSVNDPSHSHGISDPGHFHNIYAWIGRPGVFDDGLTDAFTTNKNVAIAGEDQNNKAYIATNANGVQLVANSGTNIGIFGSRTNISIASQGTGITINPQGGNGSHNNIQPSIVCNAIIKI